MILVQILNMKNKLKERNGYVMLTLGKVHGIRADLVIIGEDWQGWTFPQVVDALRKWTASNSKIVSSSMKK